MLFTMPEEGAVESARDAARKEWRRSVGITAGLMALAVALTGLGMTFWHDREIAALEDAQSNVVREAVAVSEIPRQSAPAVIPDSVSAIEARMSSGGQQHDLGAHGAFGPPKMRVKATEPDM